MKESKKVTKKITVEPKLPETKPADDGYYYLVSINSQGGEIPGTEFRVSPRTYTRAYAGNPNFAVKKKP